MASTRIVEEERGTYTGLLVHPHNGYYAGNFRDSAGDRRACQAAPLPGWSRPSGGVPWSSEAGLLCLSVGH